MKYAWTIPALAAFSCMVLAAIVALRGPKGGTRQVFVFLAGMLTSWNLFFAVLYSVQDYATAFELTRLLRVGSFFMIPAILHLCISLRPKVPKVWIIVLIIDYAVASSFVIANAGDAFVSHLRQVAWGYATVGTRYYNVLSFYTLGNGLTAIAVLIHQYITTADARMRLQLKFWVVGMLIALPLGLTNLLPSYGLPFFPLGNIGTAAWAAIVAYAIVRHRLMDIEVVVTKGIAYAGVFILLLLPSFVASLAMQNLAFGALHYDFSIGILLLLTFVGVLFPRLGAIVERRLERSLFRERYENRVAISAFARRIVRILDRDRLVVELCDTLGSLFRVDRIALFLSDDEGAECVLQRAVGLQPATKHVPRLVSLLSGWHRERGLACERLGTTRGLQRYPVLASCSSTMDGRSSFPWLAANSYPGL